MNRENAVTPIKVASPSIGDAEIAAVADVLRSGQYVSGKRVEAFERAFAEYIGCGHAVAVSSGTAALYIALEAAGIGRGDEVIVPPLSFFATVSAVLYTGARPIFADVDSDDLCLSPESVREHWSERTRAVIPVHLFGCAARVDELRQFSDRHGAVVLEDCAQAHGTRLGGVRVGSFGTAGAFSFFATKHMTTGEGGMITTDDGELAAACRMLCNHGMSGRDEHQVLGYNHRMTEMEAALGMVQLARLDELNERRIANSRFLIECAASLPWATMPLPHRAVEHTYFWCPIGVRVESGRDIEELKEHLRSQRIGFRERYVAPLYRQPALARAGLDYSGVCLPHAEAAAGRYIGLPNHPGLEHDDLQRISTALRSFCGASDR